MHDLGRTIIATSRGIFSGCAVVLIGLIMVLLVACMIPATQVDSFQRFIMVGAATGIPYAFGVLVGVSAVYHARHRGRFIAAFGACAIAALVVVFVVSDSGSIFSPPPQRIEDHLGAAITTVWVFLPLMGLVFGALAVAIGRREDTPTSA